MQSRLMRENEYNYTSIAKRNSFSEKSLPQVIQERSCLIPLLSEEIRITLEASSVWTEEVAPEWLLVFQWNLQMEFATTVCVAMRCCGSFKISFWMLIMTSAEDSNSSDFSARWRFNARWGVFLHFGSMLENAAWDISLSPSFRPFSLLSLSSSPPFLDKGIVESLRDWTSISWIFSPDWTINIFNNKQPRMCIMSHFSKSWSDERRNRIELLKEPMYLRIHMCIWNIK